MGMVNSIRDWLKYERLHHYPELLHLPRDIALKRLEAVEDRVQHDLRYHHGGLILAYFILWVIVLMAPILLGGTQLIVAAVILSILFAGITLAWHRWNYRMKRDRIRALIASERYGENPPTCLQCGYDLRGSPSSTCPECGFDALVKPEGYE